MLRNEAQGFWFGGGGGTLGAAQTRQGDDPPAPRMDGDCLKGFPLPRGSCRASGETDEVRICIASWPNSVQSRRTHCTFGARVLMYLWCVAVRDTWRGEALKVECFGKNSPVDCFCRINRPEHRNGLKIHFGAESTLGAAQTRQGSDSPAPRMDGARKKPGCLSTAWLLYGWWGG